MGFWNFFIEILKFMMRRPEITFLCFTFSLFTFRLWDGANCELKTRPAPQPRPIFNASNYVSELPFGSLNQRDRILAQSEVSFLFYYAPWCHLSVIAAAEFEKVARKMDNEISFIAINCWWGKGECRGSSELQKFPQVYLHHQNRRKPIRYSGPHLARYYIEFLKKGLSPFMYLGRNEDVDTFLNTNQISIIASFSSSFPSKMFQKFTEAALVSLEKYTVFPLQFGVVLNHQLSSSLELKHNTLKLYDQTNSGIYASKQLHIATNTTPESIVQWAYANSLALRRILATGDKSNDIYKALKEGPALLAFVTDFNQVKMLEQIAVRYKQKQVNLHCCKSFDYPRNYSICLKNSNAIFTPTDCTVAYLLMENIHKTAAQNYFHLKGLCTETWPLYDYNRTRMEVCMLKNATAKAVTWHSSIDNLGSRINRTLNFVAFDLELNKGIAEDLGLLKDKSQARSVILDLVNEHKFIMNTNYTRENLEKFILNYTNDLLLPMKTNENSKAHSDETNNDLHIQNLSAHDFERLVHQSSKDMLVYYHAHWCGGCSLYSHTLLTFQTKVELDNLMIYQVEEKTNDQLSYTLTAPTYPTLVLFLGNRTRDSVVFSRSVQCTLPNIIGFLLRHTSPRTKAQLLLSTCSRSYSYGSNKFTPSICRSDDILKTLKKARVTTQQLKMTVQTARFKLLKERSRLQRVMATWRQPNESSWSKSEEATRLQKDFNTKRNRYAIHMNVYNAIETEIKNYHRGQPQS